MYKILFVLIYGAKCRCFQKSLKQILSRVEGDLTSCMTIKDGKKRPILANIEKVSTIKLKQQLQMAVRSLLKSQHDAHPPKYFEISLFFYKVKNVNHVDTPALHRSDNISVVLKR